MFKSLSEMPDEYVAQIDAKNSVKRPIDADGGREYGNNIAYNFQSKSKAGSVLMVREGGSRRFPTEGPRGSYPEAYYQCVASTEKWAPRVKASYSIRNDETIRALKLDAEMKPYSVIETNRLDITLEEYITEYLDEGDDEALGKLDVAIAKFLTAAKNSSVCHGDLHTENVMLRVIEDDEGNYMPGRLYAIDWETGRGRAEHTTCGDLKRFFEAETFGVTPLISRHAECFPRTMRFLERQSKTDKSLAFALARIEAGSEERMNGDGESD